MSETTSHTTVLFADICDSTSYFRRFGDADGRRIVLGCLASVGAVVGEQGGRVVDRVGDEVMCVIPDLSAALATGFLLQDRLAAEIASSRLPRDIRLRVGLHHGPVLSERNRIFGDTVHTAKRLVDLAKCNQVLTSGETLSAAGSRSPNSRFVDRLRIKGQEQPIELFELVRRGEDMTQVAVSTELAGELYERCTLRMGGAVHVVDDANPCVKIGRLESCEITIAHACVSREHGRVDFQKGRIIFTDLSTNGTYVSENPSEEAVLVRREQRWLRERGTLRFGSMDDPSGLLTLQYLCIAD